MSSSPDISKTTISGRSLSIEDFIIKKFLGEGSYGKVCLAIDKQNPSQKYAIKTLEKYQVVKFDKIDAVMREKDIVMSLDHPTIIKLHHTFQDDNNLYFAFELAEGGSLTKFIQTH